jgi:3-oxoacyl-[acyl-carrier protein] reductase
MKLMRAADLFDLTGEVALVTGASSGLGARFAQVLAANGARVVLVARRMQRLEDVAARIAEAGGQAIAVEADVTDADAMRAAFDLADKTFGPVTLLVNNAGVAQSARSIDMSEAEWRRVLSIDLDAVFAWSQEGARRMIADGKPGAIVNLASVLAFGVSRGVAAYAVAKAGVVQLTKAMGLELANKGVRVNAIAPGWFVTEINDTFLQSSKGEDIRKSIPLARFGQDGDLDGVLLLLASRAGGYMTGTTVVVDGGQIVALG